jgi:hypothetical protein
MPRSRISAADQGPLQPRAFPFLYPHSVVKIWSACDGQAGGNSPEGGAGLAVRVGVAYWPVELFMAALGLARSLSVV